MKSDAAAPRRKRQSGVRGRILDMLGNGPMLAQDILEKGGFSAASLYLNLKALKSAGSVDTEREGRSVRYSLVGGKASAPAAVAESAGEAPANAPKKRGRKPGSVSKKTAAKKAAIAAAPVAGDLKGALGVLVARLAPIGNVNEKLMVLSQLADSLPGPVSSVLKSVIDDLSRLSGKS